MPRPEPGQPPKYTSMPDCFAKSVKGACAPLPTRLVFLARVSRSACSALTLRWRRDQGRVSWCSAAGSCQRSSSSRPTPPSPSSSPTSCPRR
eukprot:3937782-Rhodomonas_salina.2